MEDCSAAFSPPAAFLSTHWVSHYSSAGPGRGRVCLSTHLQTFLNSHYCSPVITLDVEVISINVNWPQSRALYIPRTSNNKPRQLDSYHQKCMARKYVLPLNIYMFVCCCCFGLLVELLIIGCGLWMCFSQMSQ